MIEINRGTTIKLQFVFWQDSAKTLPVNLTGATLTVPSASRNEIKALIPVIANAALGLVTLIIPEEITWTLAEGTNNYFVIEAQFSQNNIMSPRIQIKVNG